VTEWNYTKCAEPFSTQEEARKFMVTRGFGGHILKRDHGGFTAVCPTYPEGHYPDAVVVESVDEAQNTATNAPNGRMSFPVVDVSETECCA
jgi:hypothetical protein